MELYTSIEFLSNVNTVFIICKFFQILDNEISEPLYSFNNGIVIKPFYFVYITIVN